MPQFTDLVVRCADLTRELRFFVDGLGLGYVFPQPRRADQRSAILDMGGYLLEFHQQGLRRPVPTRKDDVSVAASLVVNDVDRALQQALDHGGQQIGETLTFPGEVPARFATVASPDGLVFLLLNGDVPAYRRRLGVPEFPKAITPPQLNELILRVPDAEVEGAFWEHGVGLPRVPTDSSAPHIRHYDLGGPILEIIGNCPPVANPPQTRHEAPMTPNIMVDDIHAGLARVVAAGGTPLMEIQPELETSGFVYVRTSSGHTVDLVYGDVRQWRSRIGGPPLPVYPGVNV
jgi:predicted enzyme related to lactoylglutathione lyase